MVLGGARYTLARDARNALISESNVLSASQDWRLRVGHRPRAPAMVLTSGRYGPHVSE